MDAPSRTGTAARSTIPHSGGRSPRLRQDAMTTAQYMFASTRATHARTTLGSLLLACALILGACASQKYVTPTTHLPAHPAPEGAIWAVAPLRNESGVSIVDELAVTDILVAEMSDAPGIVVLPVNRTIAAMRSLNLPSIDTPAQARQLARTLGADALVVGSITAWDPYDPPVLGISLALFQGAGPAPTPRGFGADEDPMALRGMATDGSYNPARYEEQPLAVYAAVLDASNGTTRELIRAYAEGRHDPRSALGWKRFTASMSLYAKFACFEASRRLVASERQRMGVPEVRAEKSNTR